MPQYSEYPKYFYQEAKNKRSEYSNHFYREAKDKESEEACKSPSGSEHPVFLKDFMTKQTEHSKYNQIPLDFQTHITMCV